MYKGLSLLLVLLLHGWTASAQVRNKPDLVVMTDGQGITGLVVDVDLKDKLTVIRPDATVIKLPIDSVSQVIRAARATMPDDTLRTAWLEAQKGHSSRVRKKGEAAASRPGLPRPAQHQFHISLFQPGNGARLQIQQLASAWAGLSTGSDQSFGLVHPQ